jgi:pSer/pThr/pTyr-binding forkhead associated (FHA) protein
VVVADQKLSRHHCRIEPENDSWVVTDLNSRNGTFIARERVQKHTLHSGDVIAVADVRITFHGGAFAPARPIDPPPARQHVESEHPTLVVPPLSRPMPVPKPKPADAAATPLDDTIRAPLPFTRPPARPIVNPPEKDQA